MDKLHRLTAMELSRQLEAARKDGLPVSAALLSSAIAYLKLTDTRDPAQPTRKHDRLARLMPSADELDAGMRPTE